jgi:hypothetical protein
MIRWEEQPDGNWLGYSGQALVATATQRDENRWDWDVPGAGKPKGWRNSGHRTDELEARRAADAYWDKWLTLAALKPDLGRLAEASAPSKPRRKKSEAPPASRPERQPERRGEGRSIELDVAKAKVDDLQRRLERAEARATKAEDRASDAEARANETERTAKERIAKMRTALGD